MATTVLTDALRTLGDVGIISIARLFPITVRYETQTRHVCDQTYKHFPTENTSHVNHQLFWYTTTVVRVTVTLLYFS